jgi:hypothetical protein
MNTSCNMMREDYKEFHAGLCYLPARLPGHNSFPPPAAARPPVARQQLF